MTDCDIGHKIGPGNVCERCGVVPNCCCCGHEVAGNLDTCERCGEWLCEACTWHVDGSECDFCSSCAELIIEAGGIPK